MGRLIRHDALAPRLLIMGSYRELRRVCEHIRVSDTVLPADLESSEYGGCSPPCDNADFQRATAMKKYHLRDRILCFLVRVGLESLLLLCQADFTGDL